MKPFWIVCVLAAGVLGITGSCGPQHRYCPNDPEMECRVNSDAAPLTGMGGMTNNGPCDGATPIVGPDGSITCS